MTVRRQTLSRTVQRRASQRRLPLHVERLEARCMLMADEVVPVDVIEPVEENLALTTMALECGMCLGMFPCELAPEIPENVLEPFEFLIDPIVATGEIDASELMFFSMGFEGAEPFPSEEFFFTEGEIVPTEDPVDIIIETAIDPIIFASFSVTNGDGPAYESATTTPPPKTPTSKAFAAFGRSPTSFAASVASAVGSMGFDSDNGFVGGRRRGRR